MKKRNLIGLLVMVLLIAVALPLGVHTSFAKLAEEVEDDYYYDSSGFSIYDSIDAREGAAHNLITVANRYTGENAALTGLVGELEYWVNATENTYSDFARMAAANQSMGEAAQALYDELKNTQLSERDQQYPDQLMAQMDSEQDKINRSSYNDKARAYNQSLEAFPVSLLRHLAGVSPLATFDYAAG